MYTYLKIPTDFIVFIRNRTHKHLFNIFEKFIS